MEYEILFGCPECECELTSVSALCGREIECINCGKLVKVPIPGLYENFEIGDFVLVEKIGVGGMGEVWLANQLSMNRQVALKVLSPHLVENQHFVERFLGEAVMAGRLEHKNIITAFTAGSIGDYYFLATSFVDGIELADKIKIEGPLHERQALKISRGIACALKYAWEEHRMIHRDIKPGNIMIDQRGEPKLMDMGISKIADDDSLDTRDGLVVGTPDYISPEQAKALSDLDFRTDIYSLGASLYHILTGQAAYHGESIRDTLRLQVCAPPPDPRDVNHKVSPGCAELVMIMMAKDREERHSRWDYVIDDIDAVMGGRAPMGNVSSKLRQSGHHSGSTGVAADAPIQLSIEKKMMTKKTAAQKNTHEMFDSDITMPFMDEATIEIRPDAIHPADSAKIRRDTQKGKPRPKSGIMENIAVPDADNSKRKIMPPPKIFDRKRKIRRRIFTVIFILLLLGGGYVYLVLGRKLGLR
ncbi:serine/threonine-protein kinase [Lentisphaerota bacterium ZTH]|nr:serine/threonine protein kinase [Lentisphaerota bacterium]WET06110.1 serine/threonine-protein kinase [Lentisphaerota bacterium ZTH]